MKSLLAIAFALCALPSAASDTFQASLQPGALQPGMYSFADVYRLTVSGAALSNLPALALNDAPVRVAAAAAPPAPDAAFSIAGVGEPRGWLLLSGLALALWVARRRLGHSF
ncbi:MAG: hypothetical protein A3G81_31010 [Betaproteobacteria bacterium RIFCSPLOWO2_12_FULL_65_14]|nr:MAG: hypothetical protein A3G81_31010 [Betaproteobacteria bacterium RIFCSPLOWO2_12_FULL_65_14]